MIVIRARLFTTYFFWGYYTKKSYITSVLTFLVENDFGSGKKTGLGLPLLGDLKIFTGVVCDVKDVTSSISSESDDMSSKILLLFIVTNLSFRTILFPLTANI